MINEDLVTHCGKAKIISDELQATVITTEDADWLDGALRDSLATAQNLADAFARAGVDVRDQLDLDFWIEIPLADVAPTETHVCADDYPKVSDAAGELGGNAPDFYLSLRSVQGLLDSGAITQDQAMWARWHITNALRHPMISGKYGPQIRPLHEILVKTDPRTGAKRYRFGSRIPGHAVCAERIDDLRNPPPTAFPDDASIIAALPEYLRTWGRGG